MLPWDQKGFKFPGGAPYHPSGFMSFVGASALVNGKTKGLYFAAKALLSTVYEGALVNFDNALKIEARWFTKVLMTKACTNMTSTLFLNKEKLEKGMVRPTNVDNSNLQEIAISKNIESFHIDTPDRISVENNTIFHKPLGSELIVKNNFLPEGEIKVGITSGASTPDKVVADVIEKLIDIAA